MQRRSVLKSVAAAVIGTGLFSGSDQGVLAAPTKKAPAAKTGRMPFIETHDGTSLYYKLWGAGAGTQVLFIHSWALNSDMWQYQMDYLARRGVCCIAYDRRGHGRSSQPGDGYDYSTLANDLDSVIQQLNLRDLTLVSHSMGAGEVVRYLSNHGASRIRRIAFISPTTPFLLRTSDNPDGIDRTRFDKLRAALSKDSPRLFADGLPAFFGHGLPNVSVSPEMIQWGINMCVATSLRALMDCNLALIETDFRAEMRRISVRTLIIQGDADQSAPLPLTGQKSAQLIENSVFKVYNGAPHGLVFSHMESLNSDLLKFVKDRPLN